MESALQIADPGTDQSRLDPKHSGSGRQREVKGRASKPFRKVPTRPVGWVLNPQVP